MSTTANNTTGDSFIKTSDATATLNRDDEGEALGAMMYLTAEDLRALGVAVDTADEVSYQVDDGRLIVE